MMKWPAKRLGDLTDILSGFAFDSQDFNDSDGLPLVRIRDVVPGRTSTHFNGPFHSRYLVDSGDILIGMDGEFNRARWRGGKALLNQRVCRIASSSRDLDESYLFYFLPAALKAIEDATPFVTVKHLSVKQIRDIAIPLPPIPEQRRIAEILDKADALRAKRRAALAQLDTVTQSIFLDMFGDPATNPKGWPVASLGSKCTIVGEYGANVASKAFDPTLPRYVRITDVTEGGALNDHPVSPAGRSGDWEAFELAPGDLLFARSGATVGKTYMHTESNGRCVFAGYMIRFRPDRRELIPEYLFAFTRTAAYRGWVAARQRVVAQPNINAKQYSNELLIPLPPIRLQENFAARLANIAMMRSSLWASRVELDALFAALQQAAFQGEL
jgi:type I restriction enzyme S subunit